MQLVLFSWLIKICDLERMSRSTHFSYVMHSHIWGSIHRCRCHVWWCDDFIIFRGIADEGTDTYTNTGLVCANFFFESLYDFGNKTESSTSTTTPPKRPGFVTYRANVSRRVLWDILDFSARRAKLSYFPLLSANKVLRLASLWRQSHHLRTPRQRFQEILPGPTRQTTTSTALARTTPNSLAIATKAPLTIFMFWIPLVLNAQSIA